MKLIENSRGQGCSKTQGGGYEVGGGDEEGEESAVDGLTAGPRLGEEGKLPRPPVGDLLHLARHCCVIYIQNLSILRKTPATEAVLKTAQPLYCTVLYCTVLYII